MTNWMNNLECESNGVTITTLNSGCGSNTAFTHEFGTRTYSTLRSAHGAQCAEFAPTASSAAYVGWDTTSAEPYGRAYIYLTAAPPANMQLGLFLAASDIRLMIRVLSTRAVAITDSGFTNRGTSTALALDTWHRIEWSATTGTAAGLVELRIFSGANMDGATPDQTITATTMTIAEWDRVLIGAQFSAVQTYTFWADDLGRSDTTWLGPASGGTQTIALTPAVETDSAIILTRGKAKAIALASETGTASTLGRLRSRPVGIATEAGLALAMGRGKTKGVGVASETDTALAVASAASSVKASSTHTVTAPTTSTPTVTSHTPSSTVSGGTSTSTVT